MVNDSLRDTDDDKPLEWGKAMGAVVLIAALWLIVLGLVWLTARVLKRL